MKPCGKTHRAPSEIRARPAASSSARYGSSARVRVETATRSRIVQQLKLLRVGDADDAFHSQSEPPAWNALQDAERGRMTAATVAGAAGTAVGLVLLYLASQDKLPAIDTMGEVQIYDGLTLADAAELTKQISPAVAPTLNAFGSSDAAEVWTTLEPALGKLVAGVGGRKTHHASVARGRGADGGAQ